MLDRRTLLRRSAGLAGSLSLGAAAGCAAIGDGGGGDGDSTFLAPLPDPRPAVVPSYHAAYSYDPSAVIDVLGDTDAMPGLSRKFVDVIRGIEGNTVADLDRIAGQTTRQIGHPGTDVAVLTPRGTDLLATGDIAAGATAKWLGGRGLTALGTDRGYELFGGDGPVVEAFAVDDAAFAFGSREATGAGPEDVATTLVDGVEAETVPHQGSWAELTPTIDALPEGLATVATAFDLIAERPDTGTDAYDAVASSLVAAGVVGSVKGQNATVTRVLRYRRDRVPALEDVQAAVDQAVADDHFHGGDWEVSASGRTVRIKGTMPTPTLIDDPAALRVGVPVPAFADLTVPVDPGLLGRDPPPRVNWGASQLDDGRIAIVHNGGPEVSDLTVAYEVDGERRREAWPGPVTEGDRFETEAAPDAGSLLDLVWARGTANETILLRIELPDG